MPPPKNLLSLVLVATLPLLASTTRGQSYTPEHPKVQEMVQRGLNFLENTNDRVSGAYQFGEPVLVGYTFLKATGDVEHPKVQQGIASASNLAGRLENWREQGESKIVYEAAVGAILLASVDALKYQREIGQYLYWFERIQKPHGGFGYLAKAQGDTSQVQYIMLALWTIHEAGLDVSFNMVESTLNYLRFTMDPSGAWGYQGKIGNGRLVPQDDVSKSLATAGLGALIVGGDILGFYGARKKKNDENEGIPEAFKRIDLKEKLRAERKEITLSRSDTDGAIAAGIRYQNNSQFAGVWYFYWRYSQERYESFVEIVEGKQNKSPTWYNQGVEELARMQNEEGAWGKTINRSVVTTAPIDTSFAILFLIRSTQKAIGKLDEGVTFGGYQLPGNVTNISMMGNRIVSDEETSVENLLSMLEDEKSSNVQVGLLPKNLQLTDDPTQRKEQVARLSRLLVSGEYQARQIAAKLLGRTDDLDVVPDLIYALTDPNDLVPMIAEESLRLLSRKLNAGKLMQNPTDVERKAAEAYWKKWYTGLRPDYIFVDR